METIGLIILIIICVIVFGLLGKLIGFLWAIFEWLLGGIGNCLGCCFWVFLIIAFLIALGL